MRSTQELAGKLLLPAERGCGGWNGCFSEQVTAQEGPQEPGVVHTPRLCGGGDRAGERAFLHVPGSLRVHHGSAQKGLRKVAGA